MSKTASFHIAVAQIEQVGENGKREYVEPKSPVRNLSEKDVENLMKLGAIREPNEDEIKLEELMQRDAETSGRSDRRRNKKGAEGEGSEGNEGDSGI